MNGVYCSQCTWCATIIIMSCQAPGGCIAYSQSHGHIAAITHDLIS